MPDYPDIPADSPDSPASLTPVTKAATLKYDRDNSAAPRLTAKGRGLVADKIIAIAESHNIPVHRDADLIEILDKTELDTEIPLEVYAVVAEIFAYIYKVNQQKKTTTP